ncbi:hypothetical protein ACFSMW_07730 [Virgibacillus halophilus]|uniref:hypothetical protein n=1 Tax=Tigheibacillus halophilus TaxID=361280 RepID=UPI0036270640
MFVRILMFAGLILPWFTLFLASPITRKKFMPVTIFTALCMTIIFQIAYTYDWWAIHKQIVPWGYMTDVSFAYGIFSVGTFWIFKLASHRFSLFIVVNMVMDALMAFVALPILNVLGVATYENISAWQYFLVMFALSFVIYGYHVWQRKIFQTD